MIERGKSITERVLVYTKPNCIQCDRTKKLLIKEGIPHTMVDVNEDKQAAEYLRAKGVKAMPLVVTPDGEWTGFRPDRIRSLR